MRPLYVGIGIDCDPDRCNYPDKLTFDSLHQLGVLFGIPDVRWTLNVRSDAQIMDRLDSPNWCYENEKGILDAFRREGHEIAWHLHYYDKGDDTFQDVYPANIHRNILCAKPQKTVHMGWLYQDGHSLDLLRAKGVEIDYSPAPRMRSEGNVRAGLYNWDDFAYRPQIRRGIKMLPAYTYRDPLLRLRHKTERVLLHPTVAPILYRRLLKSFFRDGHDFLVTYFHADELFGYIGDYRDRLYNLANLKNNISNLKKMALTNGYGVKFLSISQLAEVMFSDEHLFRDR